jgi:hypothetical protein
MPFLRLIALEIVIFESMKCAIIFYYQGAKNIFSPLAFFSIKNQRLISIATKKRFFVTKILRNDESFINFTIDKIKFMLRRALKFEFECSIMSDTTQMLAWFRFDIY